MNKDEAIKHMMKMKNTWNTIFEMNNMLYVTNTSTFQGLGRKRSQLNQENHDGL